MATFPDYIGIVPQGFPFIDIYIMYCTDMFEMKIQPPPKIEKIIIEPPKELILEPGQYLIKDAIFGELVVGEIGRVIYTPEYIRQRYYNADTPSTPGNPGTKEWLAQLKKNREEYVHKKFQRVEVPFTDMVSTLAQVRWVLHFKFNFSYESIRPEVMFFEEFAVDSLEMHCMIVEFQHYFNVTIDFELFAIIENDYIMTIQDLMDYLDLKRGIIPGKNLYPPGPLPDGFIRIYPRPNIFRDRLA